MLSDLGALEQTKSQERVKRVPIERFQWPLAISVILFVFELAMPLVSQGTARRIFFNRSVGSGVSVGLLLIAVLANIPNSSAAPIESYLKNREGLKKFESDQTDEAERKFADAQAADPSQVIPRFNLGVTQMKKGDSKSAIHSFEASARSAGMSGDADLLAQSLYNLGSAYEKDGQDSTALRSFASAVRMAEFAKNDALAMEARKRIQKLEEQSQKNKQNQKQGGGGGGEGSQGEQKESKDLGESKNKQDRQNQRQSQIQNFEDPSVSRRRQFKGEKLSPEDSERVMGELSSREKQLQAKLKRQRGARQSSNDRDW
ncbi:hypothetical protein EBZ37_09055 [bacterium]|nr:hypothetical protein [bacterium]